ncbi:MAG: DEAD/DEAH box helicase [Bacteroidaceae bacterium]|nr:DEAD/DEAH box helicase [Bacteroidaceae bacterium]
MTFDEFGFEYEIMDGLDAMNFREATPIQEKAIPVIMDGYDLIACAQTGTGKTAAFILPLMSRLLVSGNEQNKVKAVIITPTRELAQQIDLQFEGFSYFAPISTVAVSGGGDGASWEQQKRGLTLGADVIIATPGRLISHLKISNIDFSGVEYLILDEADRMLDMGFYDDIMDICSYMPKERQTLLFSATMPPKIRQLAKNILHNPVEVSVAISKPNEAIDQSAYVCYEAQKIGIIQHLFAQPIEGKTIVFASSKIKCKEVAYLLKKKKFRVAAMHSDLAQEERDKVMLDFKNNKLDILVATDIVARGIDIDQIGLVINYDVPRDPEDYIHRIGRTARANADGRAMTFVAEDDQVRFQRIERFLGYEVRKEAVPEELGETPQYKPMLPDKGRNRNRGRYRNHKRRGQTSQPHTPQEGRPQESKNNRNHRNRRKQAKGGNGKESNNNKPQ